MRDGEIFEHKGHSFRFQTFRDEGMFEPWKEHDGHGIVSDWRNGRDKAPGERVLTEYRGSYRFYDVAKSTQVALQDGWGASHEAESALAEKLGRTPTKREIAALAEKLGRTPTKREIAALAVDEDFERMRTWCNDEWYWLGIDVTLLKADEDAPNGFFDTRHTASLCGIESDARDYIADVARELADEILFSLKERS